MSSSPYCFAAFITIVLPRPNTSWSLFPYSFSSRTFEKCGVSIESPIQLFYISPAGLVFIFFMVDKIGRKMVQLVAFIGSAVFLAALFICTKR